MHLGILSRLILPITEMPCLTLVSLLQEDGQLPGPRVASRVGQSLALTPVLVSRSLSQRQPQIHRHVGAADLCRCFSFPSGHAHRGFCCRMRHHPFTPEIYGEKYVSAWLGLGLPHDAPSREVAAVRLRMVFVELALCSSKASYFGPKLPSCPLAPVLTQCAWMHARSPL